MTLINETGDGIEGATSYVSLEEADSHFTALAHEKWAAATDGQREEALIRASLHIDSYSYPGVVLDWKQGLKWPRYGAYDGDGRHLVGLPHALRTATLELAASFIADDQGPDERQAIKQKVGPIELTYGDHSRRPSFVFRLLRQIGARAAANTVRRG